MKHETDRITIRDVARVAGVAPNTVSLVVRGSSLVAEATRIRVQEVIDLMGYAPHAAAAALRSTRAQTIGYLFHGQDERIVSQDLDLFRNRLIRAILARGQMADHFVLFNNFISAQQCLTLISSRRVDGLLLDFEIDDNDLSDLLYRHAPFVLIGRAATDPRVHWIKADERGGAYTALQHLIALGHQHIGMLTAGEANHPIVLERLAGCHQALDEAELTLEALANVEGDWTFEAGYEQGIRLLTAPSRPTALFVVTEILATGCLHAARSLGLRVPEDVSIVTVEDSSWVNYTMPQLTAVHVPMYEMGIQATETLLQILVEPGGEPQHIIVPTQFVERASTGPAPAGA